MRAGVNAVKAERTIQVARFSRHEQLQLASTLDAASANAFVCRAGLAHVQVARLHLQWRDERLDKIELTDGADVLAEARPLE